MVKDNIMLVGNISKTGGIICVLALVLLTLPLSFAEGIHIYRDYPSSANLGEVIQINITVENTGSLAIDATIQENVGDYTIIEPNPVIPKGTPGMIGLRGPYFEWNVSVGAMQNKTVYYKVNLTSPGEIMLSPTAVIFGNETIYGIPGSINVICNQNGICEKDLGENYMTCPQDCLTGALDGLCDLMKDGRCDPDCAQGTDVDCIGQGNNQTISPGNETTVDNETSSNNNSGDETSPGNEIPANITGGETPPKSLLETYWWVLIIVGVLVIILIAVYLKKKSGTSKEASEWKSAYESSPQQNTGPSI